jgi:hypothetical protein
MRIVGEHLRRHVPGNTHNGLVARLRLGQLRNGMVPQIIKAQSGERALHTANVSAAFGFAALVVWIL